MVKGDSEESKKVLIEEDKLDLYYQVVTDFENENKSLKDKLESTEKQIEKLNSSNYTLKKEKTKYQTLNRSLEAELRKKDKNLKNALDKQGELEVNYNEIQDQLTLNEKVIIGLKKNIELVRKETNNLTKEKQKLEDLLKRNIPIIPDEFYIEMIEETKESVLELEKINANGRIDNGDIYGQMNSLYSEIEPMIRIVEANLERVPDKKIHSWSKRYYQYINGLDSKCSNTILAGIKGIKVGEKSTILDAISEYAYIADVTDKSTTNRVDIVYRAYVAKFAGELNNLMKTDRKLDSNKLNKSEKQNIINEAERLLKPFFVCDGDYRFELLNHERNTIKQYLKTGDTKTTG